MTVGHNIVQTKLIISERYKCEINPFRSFFEKLSKTFEKKIAIYKRLLRTRILCAVVTERNWAIMFSHSGGNLATEKQGGRELGGNVLLEIHSSGKEKDVSGIICEHFWCSVCYGPDYRCEMIMPHDNSIRGNISAKKL